MRLSEFLEKGGRAARLPFPEALNVYHRQSGKTDWHLSRENGHFAIQAAGRPERLASPLDDLLRRTLPPFERVLTVSEAILNHFESNLYKDGLPLFLVRRHGSHSGIEGSARRRRGWMVKFDNAYVVFLDNFFARHIFEYCYFASQFDGAEIGALVRSHLMPFASGGGLLEKKHRAFPTLGHLTSKSQFYISHLFDINQGAYDIAGEPVNAGTLLGDAKFGDFGSGSVEQWDAGPIVIGASRCKIVARALGDKEIAFLKASNVRFLSPMNYFPFPKGRALLKGSMSGEDAALRFEVACLYRHWFGEAFERFRAAALVPKLSHGGKGDPRAEPRTNTGASTAPTTTTTQESASINPHRVARNGAADETRPDTLSKVALIRAVKPRNVSWRQLRRGSESLTGRDGRASISPRKRASDRSLAKGIANAAGISVEALLTALDEAALGYESD